MAGSDQQWQEVVGVALTTKVEQEYGVPEARTVVEKPSKELLGRIRDYGSKILRGPTGKTVLYRITSKNMFHALTSDLVDAQHQMLAGILKKVMPNGFTFMVGSAQGLADWRAKTYPVQTGEQPYGKLEHGEIDFDNGIIYITNASGETVLHEIFHASMGRIMVDYFAEPGKLSKIQVDAMDNLKDLMVQFMGMDFSGEDATAAEVATRVQNVITGYFQDAAGAADPEMDYASALQEFLAWSLTNRALGDTLKTVRVKSKMRVLVDKALGLLRRVMGLNPDQKMDMFSNISWNAGAIFMTLEEQRANGFATSMPNLKQSSGAPASLGSSGSDPRIMDLMASFTAKVGAHIAARPITQSLSEKYESDGLADAAVNQVTAAGFDLNPDQISAFRAMQAAFFTSMDLDGASLVRVQTLFDHVMESLSETSFMTDPDDQTQKSDAVRKFEFLTGKSLIKDSRSRSNMMANFLALTSIDEGMRKIVADVALPKDRKISFESTDELLNSVAESTLNTLSTIMAGERPGRTPRQTLDALDRLTVALGRINQQNENSLLKRANKLLATGDAKGSKFLSRVGDFLGDFSTGEKIYKRKRHADHLLPLLI